MIANSLVSVQMDAQDAITAMQCVVRVSAVTAAITARVEGMKAANAERQANNEALAYDAKAFFEAEEELLQVTRSQIGL